MQPSHEAKQPLQGQLSLDGAFLALDHEATEENRRREFRREIISGIGLPESVARFILALDSLSETHGFIDEEGNTMLTPTLYDIAFEMDRSEKTAVRARKDSVHLGFVDLEQLPGQPNLYVIRWPKLFDAGWRTSPLPSESEHRVQGGDIHSRQVCLPPPLTPNRGGTYLVPPCVPPPKNAAQGGDNPAPFMKDELNELHEFMNVEKSSETKGRKGWTLRKDLRVTDLIDPRIVSELWGRVLELRLMPDTAYWRETFFGLCHSMHRHRAKLTKPVGMLHAKLRSGPKLITSQVDDDHDRTWARKAIRILDGLETPRTEDRTPDPDAAAARYFDEQRRALAQAVARGEL